MPPLRGGGYTPAVRKTQVLGLVLWRGGILLAGASTVYYAARQVLRFIDLPTELQVAGSLALAGVILVLISMVMENVVDSRSEDVSER